ncbi:MAG TPA: 4Fe-4S binding protein [Candidatus Bathyarchaeia archaeon]
MPSHETLRLEHPERCIGCYNCVFACSLELFNVVSATRTAVSIKPCSPSDRFVVTFCTTCDDPPCIKACKPKALQKDKDGKLKLTAPSECEKCETFDCAEACIAGALWIDPETNKPILCTLCGECAKVCPHEVITFKEKK